LGCGDELLDARCADVQSLGMIQQTARFARGGKLYLTFQSFAAVVRA
jgi:hypothetical protein